MTTTLLALDQHLLEALGEAHGTWIQHPVTTAIAANTSVVSTHLQNYRSTADYFNNWWIYFEDKANAGVSRQITDDDGTSTLTVRGPNLTTDGANLATFRISRYPWASRTRAIIEAIDETYPALYRNVDDRTLVTGNILPNSHFDTQTTSGTPDNYDFINSNGTKTTTAGLYRGGAASVLVGLAGAGGYMRLTSDNYPRLLDLAGRTVTFRCWAMPKDADDDAFIEIYTVSNDGTTTQTLTSTTTCPQNYWTLLELENQSLNGDLEEIQFRFKIGTSPNDVYFDNARVDGINIFEYLLPLAFDAGNVDYVKIQTSSYAGNGENPCDDIFPRRWSDPIYGCSIIDDGGSKYLRLPAIYPNLRQIRLIGKQPLETLSAATDTITPDGREVNKLVAYAKYKLFQLVPGAPAVEDIGRFESAEAKALWEYRRLAGMPNKPTSMRLRV